MKMACNIKLKDICRLCASSETDASNMKNILSDDSEFANMADIIYKYFGIMISVDDVFPKEVCDCCLTKIRSFDEYVVQCVNVQKLLVKLSSGDPDNSGSNEDVNIKTEPFQNNIYQIPIESVKDESNNLMVKLEMIDVDEDVSNSVYDDVMDYPISEFLPKKKKKFKETRKKKVPSKKEKSKLKKGLPTKNREDNVKSNFNIKSDSTLRTYFRCDKCSRITKSQAALDKHKMSHIPKPDRVYTCASCPKVFNSKENLRSHERVHLPLVERYNYPCTICGNKFTTKSAVVGHTRAVHEKIKRYICDVCGYTCSTGGELIQHRAIHSDEKLFQCSKCPKKFKTGSNLKAHLDTHDDTSYPCQMCDKVLNSRRTYRKHLLVHDDLCKHVCSFCNKAFKRRQTLKVHLTCHTGDTPVQCPWCPQKFAYSSACRTHKQRCHPEAFISQQQQLQQEAQGRPQQRNEASQKNNTVASSLEMGYENISLEPSDITKDVLKLTLQIPTSNGTEHIEISQCESSS